MTERVLSQTQAAEMGFFRNVHDVTLRHKVRKAQLWTSKTLNVQSLLQIKRSHAATMARQRDAPGKIGEANPAGCTQGKVAYRFRPRTRWRDYISDLAWSCLGLEPGELLKVAESTEVFRYLLLLLRPFREEKRVWKWMNGDISSTGRWFYYEPVNFYQCSENVDCVLKGTTTKHVLFHCWGELPFCVIGKITRFH